MHREYELKILIKSQGVIETLVLLGTFLGLILQSYPTTGAHATIHDQQLHGVVISSNIFSQYQNVTHEGDLIIDDNETFTIENSEFYMMGKITLKDTSTLIIRDSKFTTIPSWDGDSIILQNKANLIITNTTLIFKHPGNFGCKILVQDYAKANITDSTLRNQGDVVADNNSMIYVNNSTIMTSTRVSTYPASGVATFNTSTAEIENSTIDGVFVWGNSTVSVKNSVAGILRTTWIGTDKTTINITNSKIDEIETWGGAPVFNIEGSTIKDAGLSVGTLAWFTSSSVAKVSASGDAKVWFLDSSVGSIETRDNATVFVGWHLPVFGLVVIPHTWVPIMQIIFLTSIIALIITILLVLRRERARRIQREELQMESHPQQN